MQLSYNKLKTFSECALKYRLSYVERLPRPPISTLAFQRRLHAALARYHHFARRDGRVQEAELLDSYAAICGADQEPDIRDKKSYQEGEEILRRYCELENAKGRVPAYLEHTLTFPFGPYVLTGKIDRIDFTENHSYSIVDYKLDRKLPDQNVAETSRQLSFYHLLVSEGLGMEAEDVRLYYLRHGVEQISSRSRSQMRKLVDWVDETASAIHKEQKWEAKEGEGCASCAFKDVCPQKTGQARTQQSVWQQGSLLWEMIETNEETEEPERPRASRKSRSVGTQGKVRQMSLEDFL